MTGSIEWAGKVSSGGLIPTSHSKQMGRAAEALAAETAFQGRLLDAHAALAGRSMDRTADLFHYANGLAAGDEQLRAALMGEVGGFINRSQSVQRNFGR